MTTRCAPSQEVRTALSALIEYLWDAEERSFNEQSESDLPVENHIFHALVVIQSWLDSLAGEPPSLKFQTGSVCATRGALAALGMETITTALNRHASGDWGDLDEEDRQANEEALGKRLRLFSVYHSEAGVRFYIITEADRSATTVLLPSEY